MKKRNKRSKSKYPGLEKSLFSKIKQQYFDLDYINLLSEEEKAWFSEFMNAYLGANTKDNTIFTDYEEMRKCWSDNNSRNRDIFSNKSVLNQLAPIENVPEESTDYEDELIEHIDFSKELEKI